MNGETGISHLTPSHPPETHRSISMELEPPATWLIAVHRPVVVTGTRGADGREIRFQPVRSARVAVLVPVTVRIDSPDRAVEVFMVACAAKSPEPIASIVTIVEPSVEWADAKS